MLVAATPLPVNADFEAGFADAPSDVAANAVAAANTGIAGLSIEDRTGATLYDASLARDRIQATAEALRRDAPDVLLVARCEAFLMGEQNLAPVIARLHAYAEAGAHCLYAPGIVDFEAATKLLVTDGRLPPASQA